MNEIINLSNLNFFQMSIFIIGCVFWLLTYIVYIRNIFKMQFVEIPFFVVCMNISWEFIWGFPFGQSVAAYMGTAIQVGYMLWFLFDCLIFYGILKYGYKQFTMPEFRNNSKLIAILLVIFGLAFFYTFNLAGYDTPIGTISAYLDNIAISGLYIILFLKTTTKKLFSLSVAWYKMLGTGLISVALVLHWNDNYFLILITSIVLILDILYIIIFYKHRKK